MRYPARISLAAAVAWLAAAVANAQPFPAEIDEVARRAMSEFRSPGMAVSVVRDGEVVHAAGYGRTEAGSGGDVDANTLFRIGSVSKAFTAAALAILADEGELHWDDPVIDYLPEFRMHDPWVTREFTIRDLLTHRSGLPLGAGDLLIFPEGNASVEEIIHAMRHLEPVSSFRSKFDYDNLMYIIAGEVVARVSGTAFPVFLEQRLLFPLGMRDCVASPERVGAGTTLATPHLLIDGEIQTTSSGLQSVVAPAGGIACSARSMALWLEFVLRRGVTGDGERLISEVQFTELLKPVTPIQPSGYLAEHSGAELGAYALGWNVSTFHGQPVYSHGGGVWGMTTFVMVLPRQGFAVFASNNLMSPAPRAVVNQIVDDYLRDTVPAAGKDWIGIIGEVWTSMQAAGEEAVARAEAERDAESEPSLPLEAYTGRYRDPWYGDVQVSLKDGGLWFSSDRNPPLKGPLEHFQYDTFIAHWTDRQLLADAYVTFTLGPEGNIERIRMKAVSPTTDFSYDFHDLDLRPVE